MTQLLEQAVEQLRQLSESEQDSFAAIILAEIASEQHWQELFSRPESDTLLDQMAEEALAESGFVADNPNVRQALAEFTHDIRAPLNSIIGFASIIQILAQKDDYHTI